MEVALSSSNDRMHHPTWSNQLETDPIQAIAIIFIVLN